MKLCYALLYYDPAHVDADPRTYLARVRAAHDLPRALAARGHQVSVVHLYPFDAELTEERVRHCFVAPGMLARSLGKALAGRSPQRARFTPAWRAITTVLQTEYDTVHFFGTSLHLNLALLALRLPQGTPAMVLHYHGGDPARSRVGRALQRYGFSRAARAVFTTSEQAEAHARAGLVGNGTCRVARLLETSSRFRPASRIAARERTRMRGDPVFVWAARLAELKDPMTALRGFARLGATMPKAHLYMYYRDDTLLGDLRSWVESRPSVRDRVHFRGELPYERMEDVYNSADFLLQASLREHSGCAVLDAMACGTIPVVTDIPSFRAIAGDVGVLFPPGDDETMARRLLEIPSDQIESRSTAVRARFEAKLSFTALARRLESLYQELTP